jgi:hypothetical protein
LLNPRLIPSLATFRLFLGQDCIEKGPMYFYLSDIGQARIDAKEAKVPLSEIIDNRNNIKKDVIFDLP